MNVWYLNVCKATSNYTINAYGKDQTLASHHKKWYVVGYQSFQWEPFVGTKIFSGKKKRSTGSKFLRPKFSDKPMNDG